MSGLLYVVNFLLATAMWLIVGRVVLGLFIRNQSNAIWQMFVIATEPPYRVSRLLTGRHVSDRWLWLVSLAWLLAARVLLIGLFGRIVP